MPMQFGSTVLILRKGCLDKIKTFDFLSLGKRITMIFSKENNILYNILFLAACLAIFFLPFAHYHCWIRGSQIYIGYELRSGWIFLMLFLTTSLLSMLMPRNKNSRVTSLVLASILLFYAITFFYLFVEWLNMSAAQSGCVDEWYGFRLAQIFSCLYFTYTLLDLVNHKKQ